MRKLYFNFKYGAVVFEDELLVDFTLEDIQEFIKKGILAEIKLEEVLIMASSKEIRERYRCLYEEDIRMGNICSDDDIPTEDEFVDDYYNETEYMEEYYERKYGE